MSKPKVLLTILVILFIAIQFFGPDRTNPPVEREKTVQALTDIPESVSQILQRSCYDCHSNETRWPWYSYVAPVSWLVVKDVQDGRSHLNFSDWAQYSERKVEKALDEICEEIQEGAMPLKQYLWLHPDARLSAEEVQAICDWTQAELSRMGAAPTDEKQEEEEEGEHEHEP